MDEYHRHCAERKKPGTKKYILRDSIYMILQNRQNESVVIEIRSLFAWGELGVQVLQLTTEGPWEPRGSPHSNGPSETTGLHRCPVAGWRGTCCPLLASFLHPCHLP